MTLSIYETIHMWTAVVDASEEWSSQLIFQFEKNKGFNGIRTLDFRDTRAMLYQLSYEATHWERGVRRSEMTWSIYEIIHMWTAVVDVSEEWSSQLIFQCVAS